jgi:hypothetical protein
LLSTSSRKYYAKDNIAAKLSGGMEHGAWNMEHETWSMKHGTWNMEHETWSMKHGA